MIIYCKYVTNKFVSSFAGSAPAGPDLPALPAWMSSSDAAPRPAASRQYAQRHALMQQSAGTQNHVAASPSAPQPLHKYPDMPSLDALTGDPQKTPPLPPHAMSVTNQEVAALPEIGPGATCDHAHVAPPQAPVATDQPVIPAAAGVRNVYVASNLMKAFLEYAKVCNLWQSGVCTAVAHGSVACSARLIRQLFVRIHVQFRSTCHCSCRCLQYNTKRGSRHAAFWLAS